MTLREPNPLIDWRVYCLDLARVPAVIDTFDNTDGTPAECQAWRDHGVIAIYQKDFGGTKTERIMYGSRYIYLEEHGLWSASSHEEIEQNNADGVVMTASLNGLNVPRQMFQETIATAEVDDDFPGAVGSMAYDIADELRFNAAVSREVELRLGNPEPRAEVR